MQANLKAMSDAEFRAYHEARAGTDPFSRDVIRTLSRLEQAELYRRSAGRDPEKGKEVFQGSSSKGTDDNPK